MRWSITLVLLIAFGTISARAQVPPQGSEMSPRDVVNQLWSMATEGELLTADGWQRASRLYTSPTKWPGTSVVRVVSNHWGFERQRSIDGKTVEVAVRYGGEAGRIDSALRYTPSSDRAVGMMFRLVFVTTYLTTYGSDGKTVTQRSPLGDEWRFERPPPGLPWTTVNTAIRYVLEMRNKTSDPAVKRNADKTLVELMKLD
jgi:hypothetical protein